ncbi:MAG: protein kinase [Polyangiales bacterium]
MSAAVASASGELPFVHEHVRVDRFVAEGGFGRVYRGHHLTLDRPVAIKLLKVPEEYSEGMRAIFVERFAQEARIIASLDHPAVVRALDFGVTRDAQHRETPYMILDWIDGQTLHRAIGARRDAGRPFDRDETLLLLTPVLEALALAHGRGIAHRDITPGNLMLVDTPTGPALRLLDFGIAKVVDDTRPTQPEARDESHTHTALLAFSPRWAAPEQAARGRTGPWTDVHALGLVCTAMLTGERPYRGSNEGLFQEIFSERRPTPAAFGVDVGTWEPVLARAVALRPESRQPDAPTLLRELQDALAPASPTRVLHIPAQLRAPRSVPAARSPWFYVAVGVTPHPGRPRGRAQPRGRRAPSASAGPRRRPAGDPLRPRRRRRRRPVQQLSPRPSRRPSRRPGPPRHAVDRPRGARRRPPRPSTSRHRRRGRRSAPRTRPRRVLASPR